MPHFFIPINWFLAPSIIILALILTTALIFWANPNLKFPSESKILQIPSHKWSFISESSMLFSMSVHLSSKQKVSMPESS